MRLKIINRINYYSKISKGSVTLISAVRAAIVTKPSVSTLISTIYPPHEVNLHNFGEPHYIPITSDNTTKSSTLTSEILGHFIFPSVVTSRCPEKSLTSKLETNAC